MAKKSYQSAAKYAKQSQRPKKKRQAKPKARAGINPAVQTRYPSDTAPGRIAQQKPLRDGKMQTISATYGYVVSDLRRTAIISLAIFAILAVLAITLG